MKKRHLTSVMTDSISTATCRRFLVMIIGKQNFVITGIIFSRGFISWQFLYQLVCFKAIYVYCGLVKLKRLPIAVIK